MISSSLTSLTSSSSLSKCFGRRKTSSLSRRKGRVVQQCKNRNVVTNNLINTKDGRDEDDDRSSSKDNNEKLMMMQAASVAPFLVFSPKAFAAGAFDSVSNAFSSPEFHELSMYTLKTLISWGGPSRHGRYRRFDDYFRRSKRESLPPVEMKTGRRRPRLSDFSEAGRWERSRERNRTYPSSG